jgi:6-phosphogluconolactonase
MSELEVFASREALYDEAARSLAAAAHDGLVERGHASLVLAGGSTPRPIYERLSSADIAWGQVAILMTDERQVPPNHPDSNYRMLRESLCRDRASAAAYQPLEVALIERFRPFDGVLLGMGEDGHFASLFPGNPMLARGLDIDGDNFVLDVPAGEPAPPQPRFSMTLHALSGSGSVLLAITGAAKRATLARASDEHLPVAAMIAALQPRILWAE